MIEDTANSAVEQPALLVANNAEGDASMDGDSVATSAVSELSAEQYMKKLTSNNAVKNLAALFGKKKPEEQATLRSSTKVDMSKFAKPAKFDYGLKIKKLRQWNEEHAKELEQREESLQEMAVAKVRGFMDAVGMFELLCCNTAIKSYAKYFYVSCNCSIASVVTHDKPPQEI